MIILGINAFHADASAALVCDGKLVAAAEEERFRRVKHWAGFPTQAIEYCLKSCGFILREIDHIAVNQNSRAQLFAKAKYLVQQKPDLSLILNRIKTRRERSHIPGMLEQILFDLFQGRFHRIEHHFAHMSSAFYVSPFSEAMVLSVDGFGDFSSAAWGTGQGNKITVDGYVHFPHSLGLFYQALTQYIGFPHYGDEYKVMGLAPYGRPLFLNAMEEIVRLKNDGTFELNLDFFSHHRSSISYQWTDGVPQFSDLFSPALEDLLGPRRRPTDALESRHQDIATSVQQMYEKAFFYLLETKQRQSGFTDLALAGGCAMNSVANGKIRRRTPIRRVYVQAAAGDAGGAIGAAFAVWHRLGGARSFVMDHAYWGPEFGEGAIASVVLAHRDKILAEGCTIEVAESDIDLCQRTAAALERGAIVGWFQGRMEWGPRALGNRSILCDPRRTDAKDILNAKIKRRETFRPFAPSILEEHVKDWFEEDDKVPFMMQVFQIRAEKRSAIPAVTHVDGSGRLQTVSQNSNPLFHNLIETFYRSTGVPMLLNTSFNENEPVVCEPAQAIECFLRTKMDMLVLGHTIIQRSQAGDSVSS